MPQGKEPDKKFVDRREAVRRIGLSLGSSVVAIQSPLWIPPVFDLIRSGLYAVGTRLQPNGSLKEESSDSIIWNRVEYTGSVIPTGIDNTFPEAKAFPLHEQGTFITEKGTTYNWYNFTELNFNPNAAKATYDYFQNAISDNGVAFDVTTVPKQGQGITFTGLGFPRFQQQPVDIYITPYNFPSGKDHVTTIGGRPPTGVTWTFGRKAYMTHLRHSEQSGDPIFAPNQPYINKVLAVEACQASLVAGVVDRGTPQLAQEVMCNSFGTAFAAKQNGLSFAEYKKWTNAATFGTFQSKYLAVTEAEWNKIPSVGVIIDKKGP